MHLLKLIRAISSGCKPLARALLQKKQVNMLRFPLLLLACCVAMHCATMRKVPVISAIAPAAPDADVQRKEFTDWPPALNALPDKKEADSFWSQQKRDHALYGSPQLVKRSKTVKIGTQLVEQRSDRMRLYDHNIFLKGLYAGKISYNKDSSALANAFRKATFIDIGSAILKDEGAPTVRDIAEDADLMKDLGAVVATDINDPASPDTRYIEIAKAEARQYPFEIREIPMRMADPRDVQNLLTGLMPAENTALIIRACNGGPDLWYSSADVELHLRAVATVMQKRDLFYFFGRFIPYKPRGELSYQVLGEIDRRVGLNHEKSTWRTVKWKKRRLNEAFIPNKKYAAILK